MDNVIRQLEDNIIAFENAKEKLIGYQMGYDIPDNFSKEEIIDMQKNAIDNMFNGIIFTAMHLERGNCLPVELSERIALLRK